MIASVSPFQLEFYLPVWAEIWLRGGILLLLLLLLCKRKPNLQVATRYDTMGFILSCPFCRVGSLKRDAKGLHCYVKVWEGV